MGPFIVQNSQQRSSRAGSAISLKANVRANVRRGPNTMKICGRVWGLFEPPAGGPQTFSQPRIFGHLQLTMAVVVVVENQRISQ